MVRPPASLHTAHHGDGVTSLNFNLKREAKAFRPEVLLLSSLLLLLIGLPRGHAQVESSAGLRPTTGAIEQLEESLALHRVRHTVQ